jgi:selenoprotein W-related protein
VIRYCTQCRWLLRAAWLAQELLSTFGTEIGEVALAPGTGGVFEITYDAETIWERKADGGFPDAKTLKRRLRDRLDPSRDLGHIDHTGADEEGEWGYGQTNRPALDLDPESRRALQLDALAAILPMGRRDRLAELLTDEDVKP